MAFRVIDLSEIRVRYRMPTMAALTNVPSRDEIFMGIDPSIKCTGVAIVHRGGYHSYTLSAPEESSRGAARLKWFYDEFVKIFIRYPTAIIAVEGYSFGSKGAVFNIGEHGGILRLAMHEQGRSWLEVPPQTLKKFATGTGSADKLSVSKELYKRFTVDLNSNDSVDATGLAIYAQAYMTLGAGMKLNIEQLTTLDKADTENAIAAYKRSGCLIKKVCSGLQ